MDADDDKTLQIVADSEATSGSNGGRMSITEEEANEASDGLETEDDDSNEDEDLSQDSSGEEDYDIYYGGLNEDLDDGRSGLNSGSQFNNNDDPEYFGYECLTVAQIKDLLSESIAQVCATVLQVSSAEAKICLNSNKWKVDETALILAAKPPKPTTPPIALSGANTFVFCEVCAVNQAVSSFSFLSCLHHFCKGCWELHFECQILVQGISTSLSCMSANCDTLAAEDFVLAHIQRENVQDMYNQLTFLDFVRSHPQLRFCPGNNCKLIIKAVLQVAKRVICTSCKSSFCFKCGSGYHAPTDCETIKRWLTRCADDSETANYISAHTKDCPKCNICIEKNGGCNHMQCYHCKHDFCWMCLGDWKTHGSEYYECSRYKENPNIAHESVHAQAREALKKYLHYYERWENHSKSMKLEAQTLAKIKSRINEKVMSCHGTWIDWQYLLDAAALLAKCRYTLQYTYPYAYYMEPSPRKELFEYQQAQLEAEIENLSWKIEHAETTDRGDLENQIDVAEKRRTSLLKDFLTS